MVYCGEHLVLKQYIIFLHDNIMVSNIKIVISSIFGYRNSSIAISHIYSSQNLLKAKEILNYESLPIIGNLKCI